MTTTNPMRPYLGRLAGVRDIAAGIKLFQVELTEPEGQASVTAYRPGQFAFVSAFGAGEAPFGIASIRGPHLEFAVSALGHVTHTLHALEVGDPLGVRGPLGNWFPLDEVKGRDVVIIGGGIGGAPLRPVIQTILDHRADYGHLTILWAARSPDLLVFTDEFDDWVLGGVLVGRGLNPTAQSGTLLRRLNNELNEGMSCAVLAIVLSLCLGDQEACATDHTRGGRCVVWLSDWQSS